MCGRQRPRLRIDPLTDEERGHHRPDLPFAALRALTARWDTPDAWPDSPSKVVLEAPAVYLVPFGPRGGQRAGVKVTAEDRVGFTAGELWAKAQRVQAEHLATADSVPGVGVFRLGLSRGLPSYYLSGARDHLRDS